MKGIMEQISEMEGKTIDYSPPKNHEEYEKFFDNMENAFMQYEEARQKKAFETSRIQKENAKCLKRKAKELGKEIPDELWIRAVLMYEQPVGSAFFERHREWFEDVPKKEESNTEKILQFAIKNFPVRKA